MWLGGASRGKWDLAVNMAPSYLIVNNAANTEPEARADNFSLIYDVIIKLCIQHGAMELAWPP